MTFITDQPMVSLGDNGRVFSYDSSTMMTSTVCSYNWDNNDATVLCRQLGYGDSGRAITVPRNYSYERSLYNVGCTGSETNLFNCGYDTYDNTGSGCYGMDDAGAECTYSSSRYFFLKQWNI